MPSLRVNQTLGRIERDLQPSGLVLWRVLYPIARALFKAAQFTVSISSGSIQAVDGGFHIVLPGDGAAPPWHIRMGSTANKRRISPGTIGGSVVPEISGVRLDADDPPEIDITPSVTNYVYLQVHPTVTRSDGFVQSATVLQGDVTVLVSTTPVPADDGNPGADLFRIHIDTINADGVATPLREDSLDWSIADFGSGSPGIAQMSFYQ